MLLQPRRYSDVRMKASGFLLAVAFASAVPAANMTQSRVSSRKLSDTLYELTVGAALAALEHKPGVTFRTEHGWQIAIDEATHTVWSFAPQGHAAYPSVVKRSIVTRDGKTYIDMDVRCEADKTACDQLVIQFQQLNGRTAGSAQSK